MILTSSHLWAFSIRGPLALHIPDGFLSSPVVIVTWGLGIALMALAFYRVQNTLEEKTIPLMGVCAAFIFAGQLINFPIVGGASGHLLGGVLAGALLGPWSASVVMSVVFCVQAIFFQDGGLTVLGANILNMGFIGTFLGYLIYKGVRRLLGRNSQRSMIIAAAIASWLSVMLSAFACGVQLSLSGIISVPFVVLMSTILGWHVLIGLGEAMITVTALTYVWTLRPNLIYSPPRLRQA